MLAKSTRAVTCRKARHMPGLLLRPFDPLKMAAMESLMMTSLQSLRPRVKMACLNAETSVRASNTDMCSSLFQAYDWQTLQGLAAGKLSMSTNGT